MRYKARWLALVAVIVASFVVLLSQGIKLHRDLPPSPTGSSTRAARSSPTARPSGAARTCGSPSAARRSASIWGHGAYVAPDWSADWLHRESTFVLDAWARAELGCRVRRRRRPSSAPRCTARLQALMRANTYDAATGTLTLDPARARRPSPPTRPTTPTSSPRAAPSTPSPRARSPIPTSSRDLAAFFFWTSWVGLDQPAGRHRHVHPELAARAARRQRAHRREPGVERGLRRPAPRRHRRAGLVPRRAARRGGAARAPAHRPARQRVRRRPASGPRTSTSPWPRRLMLAQIGVGILTAHYGVEGQWLYGFPLGEVAALRGDAELAHAARHLLDRHRVARDGALPGAGDRRPRAALPARRGELPLRRACSSSSSGSLAGQWLSVQQRLGGDLWYWFGHQGYEYVDLGRFWQIFLFVGLFVWLGADGARASPGAAAARTRRARCWCSSCISSAAIAAFYGAGLMYGQQQPPRLGRVLALVGRAPLGRGLLRGLRHGRGRLPPGRGSASSRARTVTPQVLFATTVFLAGGIIGTLHHLYFTGTPTSALALGASFSALEVVPLTLVGFEVWQNLRVARAAALAASATAGRSTSSSPSRSGTWSAPGSSASSSTRPSRSTTCRASTSTPVHGHTALFGVYGMLGIGLMLFCLRALAPAAAWRERPLAARVLGAQRRPGADGRALAAAHRHPAGDGVHRARHLVGAQRRVPADAADEPRCAGCAGRATCYSASAWRRWYGSSWG